VYGNKNNHAGFAGWQRIREFGGGGSMKIDWARFPYDIIFE
jgi:hypothetical protein